MKHFLIATLFVFTVLTGCKDDTPVDTTDNTSGDVRDNILGKYTCNYKLFNAVTGVESQKVVSIAKFGQTQKTPINLIFVLTV